MSDQKDKLTFWHQVMTLVGGPLIVALILGLGAAIISTHDDIKKLDTTLSFVSNSITMDEGRLETIEELLMSDGVKYENKNLRH